MSFGGGGDTRVREPRSQRALAEQAVVASQRYGQIVVPVRNQFMAQTRDFLDNDQNFTGTMGEASTRALGIYEQGFDDFNRAAFNKGYDPGSGAYQGQSKAIRTAMERGVGEQWVMPEWLQQTKACSNDGHRHGGQGLQSDTLQGNAALAQSQTRMLGSEAQTAYNRSSALGSVQSEWVSAWVLVMCCPGGTANGVQRVTGIT